MMCIHVHDLEKQEKCVEDMNTYEIIKSSFKSVYMKDSGNPIIPQVKQTILIRLIKQSRVNNHHNSHFIKT